jgi:hypothetical protein
MRPPPRDCRFYFFLTSAIVTIKKGEGIEAAVASVNPPGSIMQTNMLLGIAVGLAAFYAAGLIGWAILFALRRSGVHRLDGIPAEHK